MKRFGLLLIFILVVLAVKSQTIDTDSIFARLNLKFSPTEIEKLKKEFDQADMQTKGVMLRVLSMPMSSRAELVDNYEQKHKEIKTLQEEFNKVVPRGYSVFLEIKMSDTPLRSIQSVDMQVYKENKDGKLDLVDGDWDMKFGSAELDSLLDIVNWDMMTFTGLKNMFQVADCISIQSGDQTEIGFARSGLGKYSYVLFPKKLTPAEIEQYNDGCEYIYYKDNIVLKYTGGMAGPQCFTD